MRITDETRPQIDRLAEMIRQSRETTVFTGAGISTECGIPDFRSPGGMWSNNMPIDYQSFISSREMRAEAWRRKFEMDRAFRGARPGRGHRAIAHLVRIGKTRHVITQNIDNLHQASGVPEDQVIELHGNGSYARCLGCGCHHDLDDVREVFESRGEPPDCRRCGGIVKTATVSFGQAMPEEAMARAETAALSCDLFLALGSSLVVFPAAGFPVVAKRNGATLVIVNRDPTELDDTADLVIRDDIGTVLEPLGKLNG